MHRKAAGIFLSAGILLISAQGVLAASDNLQSPGMGRPAVRSDYADGNEKIKAVRLSEKKPVLADQGNGLRDVAMRFTDREIPPARQRKEQPVDAGGDSGSWFAMLVAGLGVALVSIFRRIGNLQ